MDLSLYRNESPRGANGVGAMCARPANPELRDRIVKVAAGIIEDCGPDCVTMREVAEKIGYSPTTIYLYFKDKSAILREAVLLAFDDLNETCDLSAVGPGPLDKFRQRCRAYIVWGLTHPGHYTLMFQLPWEMDWTVEWTDSDIPRFTRGRVEDLAQLRAAAAAGELAEETDFELLEDAVWAALHGTTSLTISRRLTVANPEAGAAELLAAATRTADALVNALLEGARA